MKSLETDCSAYLSTNQNLVLYYTLTLTVKNVLLLGRVPNLRLYLQKTPVRISIYVLIAEIYMS